MPLTPVEDWTIEAMKFLSCGSLQRTIWDELHYRRAAWLEKILQYGHHNLSTLASAKIKVESWRMLGDRFGRASKLAMVMQF